jgi:hypothetical protein
MRILLILAGLAFSLAAESQEIWRWVDKDGIVHYADQPGAPDAKLVTVLEPNAYDAQAAAPEYASSGGAEEERAAASPYESLSIVQPLPEQVFFGADATVNVAVELGGTLSGDHSLVFFVNGSRRPASPGGGLELRNLARGSYLLRAAVLDQDGEQLITSRQITFHVRQPSINSPQSPQRRSPARAAPRPTPRPPSG